MINIPKIIHQIWIGKSPMPISFIKITKTWKIKNPEWTHVFYDDEKIYTFLSDNYYNLLPFYNSLTYDIQKVDFLKYLLILKFGGIYVDVDYVCIKPISEIFNNYNNKEVFFTLEPSVNAKYNGLDTLLGNCFIAALPESTFLSDFVRSIIQQSPISLIDKNDKYLYVMNTTGPIALTIFYNHNPTKDYVQLLDHQLFCPLNPAEAIEYYRDTSEKFSQKLVDSYAVHLFAGTWL
jgi:inositol phosphorylceramide mannosyltransferase catalytic subunit